jgi:hypothetical protein
MPILWQLQSISVALGFEQLRVVSPLARCLALPLP